MGYRVIGFDVKKASLDNAKASGAETTIDLSDATPVAEMVQKITGGSGLDAALVCAGVQSAFTTAVQHTGFDG